MINEEAVDDWFALNEANHNRDEWTSSDHVNKAFEHHHKYIQHLTKHDEHSNHLRTAKKLSTSERKRHESQARSNLMLATMHKKARNVEMSQYFRKASDDEIARLDLAKVKEFLS